ncbi:MAG TPA: hypothetical protein VIW03_00165 [Anaeromyxobacter sp.]
MRHAEATETIEADGGREFSLPGGCILCGGDLEVRLSAGTARTVCRACRWISRPHLRRGEHGVDVIHPAGGNA